MQLQEPFRQRLATEVRYAADRMQQESSPARKLFYFSVLFGEAQRILNWQWDRDLAIIHALAQQAYGQTNAQLPTYGSQVPTDGMFILDQLTKVTSDLAEYLEKSEDTSREQLFEIIGRLAEVGYAAGGNGVYLYEKGIIKF